MMMRVVLAAILGGALVLGAGYVEHEVLFWVERQVKHPADVEGLRAAIKSQTPDPGIYIVPYLPKNYRELSAEKKKEAMEQLSAEMSKGPAGMVVSYPSGVEITLNRMLVLQYASGAIASLIVAVLVSLTRPGLGFFVRW